MRRNLVTQRTDRSLPQHLGGRRYRSTGAAPVPVKGWKPGDSRCGHRRAPSPFGFTRVPLRPPLRSSPPAVLRRFCPPGPAYDATNRRGPLGWSRSTRRGRISAKQRATAAHRPRERNRPGTRRNHGAGPRGKAADAARRPRRDGTGPGRRTPCRNDTERGRDGTAIPGAAGKGASYLQIKDLDGQRHPSLATATSGRPPRPHIQPGLRFRVARRGQTASDR